MSSPTLTHGASPAPDRTRTAQMRQGWTLPSLRDVATEAKLLLIGIPVLIWTLLPIYHLTLFAISPKEKGFSGKLWPDQPTFRNFEIVFGQQHYFLGNFWLQLWNSLFIAVTAGAITLFVATIAAFAISRLKVPGGRTVMNLALFTYSSRPPSSPCRCTRPWACTGCSTASGRSSLPW